MAEKEQTPTSRKIPLYPDGKIALSLDGKVIPQKPAAFHIYPQSKSGIHQRVGELSKWAIDLDTYHQQLEERLRQDEKNMNDMRALLNQILTSYEQLRILLSGGVTQEDQ